MPGTINMIAPAGLALPAVVNGRAQATYNVATRIVSVRQDDIVAFVALGFVPSGTPAFTSAEQTGTGSSQAVAHGLGVVPTKAIAYLTGGPASYAAPSIVFGTIDGTNVNLTVTSGWKFIVICFV